MAKTYHGLQPQFKLANVYEIAPDKAFNAVFAGFFISHVSNQNTVDFLLKLKALAGHNGVVVLMDNTYVEGSNLPISRTDEQGNTFQTRSLDTGEQVEVLKNFYTQDFLREKTKQMVSIFNFIQLKYFWILELKML